MCPSITWLNKELVGFLSPPHLRLLQLPTPYFKVGTRLYWDYLLWQHIYYPRGHQLSTACARALGPAGSPSDLKPEFCFYPTNPPHASPWCLWSLVAGSSEDGVSQAEGRSFPVSLATPWSQPSVSKTGRHGFPFPPGLVSLFSGAVLLPCAGPVRSEGRAPGRARGQSLKLLLCPSAAAGGVFIINGGSGGCCSDMQPCLGK